MAGILGVVSGRAGAGVDCGRTWRGRRSWYGRSRDIAQAERVAGLVGQESVVHGHAVVELADAALGVDAQPARKLVGLLDGREVGQRQVHRQDAGGAGVGQARNAVVVMQARAQAQVLVHLVLRHGFVNEELRLFAIGGGGHAATHGVLVVDAQVRVHQEPGVQLGHYHHARAAQTEIDLARFGYARGAQRAGVVLGVAGINLRPEQDSHVFGAVGREVHLQAPAVGRRLGGCGRRGDRGRGGRRRRGRITDGWRLHLGRNRFGGQQRSKGQRVARNMHRIVGMVGKESSKTSAAFWKSPISFPKPIHSRPDAAARAIVAPRSYSSAPPEPLPANHHELVAQLRHHHTGPF